MLFRSYSNRLRSTENENQQLKQAIAERDNNIAALNKSLEKEKADCFAKYKENEENQKIINQAYRLYGNAAKFLSEEQNRQVVVNAGGLDEETSQKVQERVKEALQEYEDDFTDYDMRDDNNIYIRNLV